MEALLSPLGRVGNGGGQGMSPAHVILSLAGLQCCHAIKILRGKRGKPLSFPALRPVAKDIVRITWTSETHSTHIAEAKPEVKEFAVDFLPDFQGRLRIHPQLLSLEITELRSTDAGQYSAGVDIASKPTSPRKFTYLHSSTVLPGSLDLPRQEKPHSPQ
uniref:Immunoglobulin I-set domain-containing protein n=1 Tax=Meleagris gallopavo TaxID=9103 RepID=A0A803YCZ6_MELGA